MGIRPSDIRLAAKGKQRATPAVHLIEPLGDVTVVSVETGGETLRMVLPEAQAAVIKAGETRCQSQSMQTIFTSSAVTTGQHDLTLRRIEDGKRKNGRKSEMNWQLRLTALAGATALTGFLTAGAIAPASAEEVTLTMAVPDWPPTRIMKKFFDEQYKPKSGNTVKLDVDFIPWPDFYTRVNASLTSGEKKYNFIVSDSQWLGAFIEGGYFRKINDLIDADPELKATMESMHPAVLNAYSTYPNCTPNYYGFPQFPDVLVTYGRKDVLCNDEEQKNFKAKYNEKLPCTGEEIDNMDWNTFEHVGEFFQRKKGDKLAGQVLDDDFYGIAYQAGKGYDFSTSSVHSFVWQHGGGIWDETKAPTGHAEGVVNSRSPSRAWSIS